MADTVLGNIFATKLLIDSELPAGPGVQRTILQGSGFYKLPFQWLLVVSGE